MKYCFVSVLSRGTIFPKNKLVTLYGIVYFATKQDCVPREQKEIFSIVKHKKLTMIIVGLFI